MFEFITAQKAKKATQNKDFISRIELLWKEVDSQIRTAIVNNGRAVLINCIYTYDDATNLAKFGRNLGFEVSVTGWGGLFGLNIMWYK